MSNNKLEINKCILTNNDCYRESQKITPKGIIVHSTGTKNPYIKRYVQPDDGVLGKNLYDNDWNRSGIEKCVHAFIGKDKNDEIKIYQTLPWDYRCWGCGKGNKGTYNDNYIQFEICEDTLTDVKYFNEIFSKAIDLCVYLSKEYNISANNIVSHYEAYTMGYASNHSDCDYWLKKFGKDMDWFRLEVSSKCTDISDNKVNTNVNINVSYTVNGIDYFLVFDPVYYFNKYDDLKKAFGANAEKLFSHFLTYGMKECRQAHPNFNVNTYRNKYVDLQKAFKNDIPSYYKHYIQYGYKEKRIAI